MMLELLNKNCHPKPLVSANTAVAVSLYALLVSSAVQQNFAEWVFSSYVYSSGLQCFDKITINF